ncbi:unnamed protein product [Alopecurus aequalis]
MEAARVKMLDPTRKRGCAVNAVLIAFIVTVPAMAILFSASTSAPAVWIGAANALGLGSATGAHDRLLGGLLADDGFDERSCRSRYQFSTYRRNPGRKPSPYLVTKLRRHEALQRRCGPGTAAYSAAVEQLRSGKSHAGAVGSPECRYLVSISYQGLGNRILAAASAFLIDTPEKYGNMLKNKVIGASTAKQQPPAFTYVHLVDFQEELGMLFPEPDAVFHHLGRYLFHPNNHVWGFITRYYDAYLATAHQRVGIQVRVFGADPESPELLKQITACTQKEKSELLAAGIQPAASARRYYTKAVLVTSLKSWYYDKLKSMYWEQAAATGEAVGVHQPSHEEQQQLGARSHDTKAWAEIYLLSLTDVLVTSGKSTFGYVAQGLGGLTPWVMYRPESSSLVPDPPCGRDVSMEPCFHNPPFYDCRIKQGADTGKIVPHVQNCKDVSWGLKLVPHSA